MPTIRLTAAVVLFTAVLATGCRVDATKTGNGDNVKIATPFGGMSVKTDDSTAAAETGLPVYPGAQIVRKQDESGKDEHGAADVTMSFGGNQLRVKVVRYRTADTPAKVLAFYRSGLGRFGPTIECSGNRPVGTPTHTPDGLSCSEDGGGREVHSEQGDAKTELKAGSRQHQHIVTVAADGTGTKFSLIALDLPRQFSLGNDTDGGTDNDTSKQPE